MHDFKLFVPGKHNIQNSLAAITMALELNINIDIIKRGLEKYNGVKRRLEITHHLDNGTILIDDYAHHPSEIKASYEIAQHLAENKIIIIPEKLPSKHHSCK